MTIRIDFLSHETKDDFCGLIEDMKLGKDTLYVDRCFSLIEGKERDVLLGYIDQNLAGFCLLNYKPAYNPFIRFNIPEFQDLNTHPDFREKGVASALVNECEIIARDKGFKELGLGVGLHSGYGNAHKLYAKLGYVADGQGVVYDAQSIMPNDIRPVDDDLCLMMIKRLK